MGNLSVLEGKGPPKVEITQVVTSSVGVRKKSENIREYKHLKEYKHISLILALKHSIGKL